MSPTSPPDLLDTLVRALQLPDTDDDLRRRARLVVGTVLATTIWAPVFAGVYLWLGHIQAAVAALAGTAPMAAVPLVLRLTRSVRAGGHALVFAGLVIFLSIGWFTGGFDAPVLTWMVLIPLVAALTLGLREGVLWSAVSVAALLVLWGLPSLGFVRPHLLEPGEIRVIALPSLVALMVVVATVAWLFDFTRLQAHEEVLGLRAEAAEALARAEEADQQKTRMLANLAYEVRHPVRSVSGLTELMLDTELTSVQREYVKEARNAADKIVDALDQIEDAARVASGLLVMWRSAFDLREVVEDVSPVEAATAQRKGVELVVSFDPDTPRYVVSDFKRIRQVLTFLTANAVARTAAGHVFVKVTAKDVRRDSATFLFEIGDSRTEPEPTRSQRDSGAEALDYSSLGVAVARQLVELLGGKLQERFVDGLGMSRTFDLSLVLDHGEHTASLIQPDRMGRRVLVADRSPLAREVLCAELSAWQLRCEQAGDAETALGLLEAASRGDDPHLLCFVDAALSTRKGQALSELIAAAPGAPPVVLLVPFGQLAGDEGGSSFRLAKPLRSSQLPAMMARALG